MSEVERFSQSRTHGFSGLEEGSKDFDFLSVGEMLVWLDREALQSEI